MTNTRKKALEAHMTEREKSAKEYKKSVKQATKISGIKSSMHTPKGHSQSYYRDSSGI